MHSIRRIVGIKPCYRYGTTGFLLSLFVGSEVVNGIRVVFDYAY